MKITFEPLDSNAEYRRLSKLLDERLAERAALREERDSLSKLIRDRNTASPDNFEGERIAAIAAGTTFIPKEPDQIRLGKVTQRLRDLGTAVEGLRTQISSAANVHSITICDSLRGAHDALVKEIFEAIVTATERTQKHKAFLDHLRDAGIVVHHFPDCVPAFLEGTQKHGRAAYWMQQIAKLGIVKKSAIPDQLDLTK